MCNETNPFEEDYKKSLKHSGGKEIKIVIKLTGENNVRHGFVPYIYLSEDFDGSCFMFRQYIPAHPKLANDKPEISDAMIVNFDHVVFMKASDLEFEYES